MYTKKEKSDIQKYYTRMKQGRYGNNYYVQPSDTCPLDVLNTNNRFVILTFDKADDYIVIGNKRYYLNKYNSIKCTDKLSKRVAVVDLQALKQSKPYAYQPKYHHQNTLEVDSFEVLEAEAKRQYGFNGLPYIKQIATFDPKMNACSYTYEPSFQVA